jgi:hypothetical protein
MRGYIFTDAERRRVREWLETGREDGSTRRIFSITRRNLDRLTNDMSLLTAMCRRLSDEGRMAGRGRLPAGFGRSSGRGGSGSTRRGKGRST